jgi:hypothetical protein
VQDRFAASTRRAAPPAPLLFERAPRTPAWGLLASSCALLVAVGVLLRVGWGDVESPLALHGPVMTSIDIVLFGAVAYGVLRALGILVTLESLPWKPGVYLFPGCVVDARRPRFLVWPMAEVDSVDRLAGRRAGLALRLRDGSRVEVRASSRAEAERADAELAAFRPELARAIEAADPHAKAELDPLDDLAMSSPIGPTAKMRPHVRLWIRFGAPIAAAIGIVIGYGLASTRNATSDHAMFHTAAVAGTTAAFQRYLAQPGGVHRAEVRETLLPRAELADAEQDGLDDVEAFARTHPDSKIDGEVQAALRRTTLAELEKAKRVGTVTALDAFARAHPQSTALIELKAARHALYARALSSWAAHARPDANTRAFFERLVDWAETSRAACEVRFRWKPSPSMTDADRSVMASGHYPGPDALPSHYVTAEALRPKEQKVEAAVVEAFGAAFPPDILSVRAGPPLAPDAAVPTDAPTLLIEYAPEWSHANTASTKPNTVFAGIILTFDAVFSLPDRAPWKLVVRTWRGAEAWKLKSENLTREDFEQRVYGAMLDGAFDQLQKRLLDVLF